MARYAMLPFAPTDGLGHLGACLSVGRKLRTRGHDVAFGYGGSLPHLIEREGFPWDPVAEVAPERERDARSWFRTTDELRGLVKSHLELLERLRPDAAITSSGAPGAIACELAGVPELNLMHYLSLTSYGRAAVVWHRRGWDARSPRRVLRVIGFRLRARGTTLARSVIADTRRELGLPPSHPELPAVRPGAVVACTTTPFLDPAPGMPSHWRYVGPLTWSPPGEPPERLRREGRRLVYVTQGSTGSARLLRRIVAALAGEPFDVIATTAGLCDPGELAALGPNVRAHRYLPGRALIEASDVAVVHGGLLTTSAALLAGTPLVVVPHRGDQIGWAPRAERLGVGVGLWPEPRAGAVRRAVRRLLDAPRYRARAAELAARLGGEWDGVRNVADLAEEMMSSTRRTAASGAASRSSGSDDR